MSAKRAIIPPRVPHTLRGKNICWTYGKPQELRDKKLAG
uniref:Uncharacterized protein n=2 Tax=unclassified Caudoviricetes TaxID=2788787 RepID=A0A8S5Q6Y4_9CAUD|nr:MAG TPA: hypothetical protein [Siphoviridae sp. ctAvK3]DAE15126.1 MAG TPA: hypothetical protein [Siphoviridae sp. ctdVv30]